MRRLFCAFFGHDWSPFPENVFAPVVCHRCGHAGLPGWQGWPKPDLASIAGSRSVGRPINHFRTADYYEPPVGDLWEIRRCPDCGDEVAALTEDVLDRWQARHRHAPPANDSGMPS